MGKPSAPPSPDYAAAAAAQGSANKETAMANWLLANSAQQTPWGTQQLTKTGPGEFDYTRTTTLNPADQARLDQTRQIQADLLGIAPQAINNVWAQIGQAPQTGNLPPISYGVDTGGQTQLNLSGASPLETGENVRNRVENTMFSKFYDRFAPAAQQQQEALRTRIANMGGVSSSDAARRQLSGLLGAQGDQFRQGVYDAVLRGGEEAQRQFGMGLQAHQQGISDITGQTQFNNALAQQQIQNAFANANLANQARSQGLQEMSNLRQMPLNELMAMLGGTQVQQPQFGQLGSPNIQPAPIFQAAQAQAGANQQAYQNQSSNFNNMLGGLGSLAGSTSQYWAPLLFSDRRLKSNIMLVGSTPGGLNIYEYTIAGEYARGVMADEVLRVNPAAVFVHPSGYFMVDYSQVK